MNKDNDIIIIIIIIIICAGYINMQKKVDKQQLSHAILVQSRPSTSIGLPVSKTHGMFKALKLCGMQPASGSSFASLRASMNFS